LVAIFFGLWFFISSCLFLSFFFLGGLLLLFQILFRFATFVIGFDKQCLDCRRIARGRGFVGLSSHRPCQKGKARQWQHPIIADLPGRSRGNA
jgi:hypothetical protein